MARSVVETIQLAATVTIVLPVVYIGVDLLVNGRVLPGAGFLAVATLMLALGQYVVRPGDLPLETAKRVTGFIAKEDDGE
ncbi:MAG: hypothetical protein ACI9PP_001807 [Halobacteriales archaeon]|jgi:hypothetical protein